LAGDVLGLHHLTHKLGVSGFAANCAGVVAEVFVSAHPAVVLEAVRARFVVVVAAVVVVVVGVVIEKLNLARCFAFAFASFRMFALEMRMLHRWRRVETIEASIGIEVCTHTIFALSHVI